MKVEEKTKETAMTWAKVYAEARPSKSEAHDSLKLKFSGGLQDQDLLITFPRNQCITMKYGPTNDVPVTTPEQHKEMFRRKRDFCKKNMFGICKNIEMATAKSISTLHLFQ